MERTLLLFLLSSIVLLLASNILSLIASREVERVEAYSFQIAVSTPPLSFNLLSKLGFSINPETPCNLTIINNGDKPVRINMTTIYGDLATAIVGPGSGLYVNSNTSNILIDVVDSGNLTFIYSFSRREMPFSYLAIPAILLFLLGSILLISFIALYVSERV
ncbi:hypothetical protein ACSU1N_01155 [Thermogladius sp. 4427co]|uniref:hypothetical protein n=1 Tax=Thermogladius sp. 4427co TaxID=3450718 RepID=UPI003F7B2561